MKRSACQAVLAAATIVVILGPPARAGSQLPPGVRVTASVQPTAAQPGTTVELQLTVTLPAGWITYDLEQVPDSVLPTQITLQSSTGFAPLESYRSPPAEERIESQFGSRIIRFFRASPTYHRPVLLSDTAAGTIRIAGWLDFQVCNEATGRCYVIHHHPFQAAVTVPPIATAPKSDGTTTATPRSESPTRAAAPSVPPAEPSAPKAGGESTGGALVEALPKSNPATASADAAPPPRRLPLLPALRVWADFDRRKAEPGEEVVLLVWVEIPQDRGLAPLIAAASASTPPTHIEISDHQGLEAVGTFEEEAERILPAGAAKTDGPCLTGQVVWRQRLRVDASWDRPVAQAVGRVDLSLIHGTARRVESQEFVATLKVAASTPTPSPALLAPTAAPPVILLSAGTTNRADGDQPARAAAWLRSIPPSAWLVALGLLCGLVAGQVARRLLRPSSWSARYCHLAATGVGASLAGVVSWLPGSLQPVLMAGVVAALGLANLLRQMDGAATGGMVGSAGGGEPGAARLVFGAAFLRSGGLAAGALALGVFWAGSSGGFWSVAAFLIGGLIPLPAPRSQVGGQGASIPTVHTLAVCEPPFAALLIGFALLAIAAAHIFRAIGPEGSGWTEIRFDVATWAALAAVASARFFVPWPEAARSVFHRAQRLLLAVGLLAAALILLAVLLEPLRAGRSTGEGKLNPFSLRKPPPANLFEKDFP